MDYKCSKCLNVFTQRFLCDYETSKITGEPLCRKCNNDEREQLGMIRLPVEYLDKKVAGVF